MRTVVVHVGGVGDFLLSCPVLEQLAEEGPVELVGNRRRLEVAVAAGLAAAAHDLERVEFDSVFSEPTATLKRFMASFDRCVVWMRDGETILESLRACGVPRVFAFPGRPPEDWDRHASLYYLECMGMAGQGRPRIAVSPSGSGSRRDVVIHPGSGGRYKNWPLDHFVAVAKTLHAEGHAVTWCAGPAEEEWVLPGIGDCLREESLVAVAQALAGARLYVGNDSGITHLAAAVGCPTVALFGPTNPKVWAPLGEHVAVAKGNPWPHVDEVLALARALIAKQEIVKSTKSISSIKSTSSEPLNLHLQEHN